MSMAVKRVPPPAACEPPSKGGHTAWPQQPPIAPLPLHLQDTFNLLPNLNVAELSKSFAVESNDMMLVMYVAALIRSVLALHNLIDNKEGRAYHEREKVRSSGWARAARALWFKVADNANVRLNARRGGCKCLNTGWSVCLSIWEDFSEPPFYKEGCENFC